MKWLQGFLSDYGVWATFLSALAGFGGVVATLVLQHRGDIYRDQLRDMARRKGITTAFLAEVRKIRAYAAESVENLDDPTHPVFLIPKVQPFVVFDSLRQHIDALREDQIEKVVACYVWLPEVSRRLSILAEGRLTPDGQNIPMQARYADVYRHLMAELDRLAADAAASLEMD